MSPIFKSIFITLGIVCLSVSFAAVPVFADQIKQSAIGADTVRGGAQNIVNILTFFGILIAVIFIIIGGFQWASGDSKNGREKIKNAVIGLIIILIAYLIIQLVVGVIGGIGGKSDGTVDSNSFLTTPNTQNPASTNSLIVN